MVMIPKVQARAPTGESLLPPTRPAVSEMDAQEQRALQIASGDALKEMILETENRPSSGSSSSRGSWVKEKKISADLDGTGGLRSGGSTPRSVRSGSRTPRGRPRTTGSQRSHGRNGSLVPRRPSTCNSARQTDRLARLELQRAALTERIYGNATPRTASYSMWRGVASDTEGVKPRVYASVPRQRVSYADARRKKVAEDLKFGSTIRRQRMDRERERELQVYERAFRLIDRDNGGTVSPAEIIVMLRRMGRDTSGSSFWETFNTLDEDGSAELDFEEFKQIMDTLPGSTRTLGDGFRHIAKMQARGLDYRGMQTQYRKPSVPKQTRNERRPLAERQQAESKPLKQEQAGSTWLGDALEMKRQVADIYAALSSIRQQSVQTKILDPPEDAAPRTKHGRRRIEQDDRDRKGAAAVTQGLQGGNDGGAGKRRANAKLRDLASVGKMVKKNVTTTRALHSNAAPELERQRRVHVVEAVDRAIENAGMVETSTDGAMIQFAGLFA